VAAIVNESMAVATRCFIGKVIVGLSIRNLL
jgi:hypothetical protein